MMSGSFKTIDEFMPAAEVNGDWLVPLFNAQGRLMLQIPARYLNDGIVTGGGSFDTNGYSAELGGNGVVPTSEGANTWTALNTFDSITFGQSTLDHYEVGTWTPQAFDAATSGNQAAGYGQRVGTFERIGPLCHITGRLALIDTNGMTGGNILYIRGLPFPAVNITNYAAFCVPALVDVAFTGIPIAKVLANVSYIRFFEHTTGATTTNITVSDLEDDLAVIDIDIVYRCQ